jgi:3-carboxy-cis,cis-muconate cycloisomerase
MAGRLVNALGSAAATAEAFSDTSTLRHMLHFESALAQAAAGAGLIPKKFAPIIAQACDPALYDAMALAEAARRTATLTVPVVKALTAEVAKRDAAAAAYVHWGATSQDVIDTAMVLQLGEALPPLLRSLEGIVAAFAKLAKKHRTTPTLGRTLLQPATPLALGQKIAGWASDIDRARRRLAASFAETQIVQFGGASGSLSALGVKAPRVMTLLAKQLKLALPPAPWFTQRVRVAAVAQDMALVVGALGKAARDISLLMQAEIAEVAEPAVAGRGGSSAMPYKRNPTSCQVALSAAIRAPGLVASLLGGMPQELERSLGGWQAEAPVLAELFCLAHGAARAMRVVVDGLEVDTAAITAHADAAAARTTVDRDDAISAAARFVDDALAAHDAYVAARR